MTDTAAAVKRRKTQQDRESRLKRHLASASNNVERYTDRMLDMARLVIKWQRRERYYRKELGITIEDRRSQREAYTAKRLDRQMVRPKRTVIAK